MSSLSSASIAVRPDVADFDVPIPEHLLRAVNLMLDLDYSAEAIEGARVHLARFGTAEGCEWVDPEHRAMVEAELDSDPAWNRPEWDEIRFAPAD